MKAPNCGRKAARKLLVEGVAVGVGPHGGHAGGIGHVVADGYGRALVGQIAGEIGDLHRGLAVHLRPAENAAAGVWITEVEAAFHLALRPVAEGVGFHAVAEVDAEVAEQLEVVGILGRAPDLRRGLAHVGVARIDEPLGIAPLRAAAGGIGFLPFETEVGEAVFRQGQADVGGERQGIAVALVVAAPLGIHGHAGIVFLEHEIHDAGDGVGAVLGGCAVTQHFEPVQGNGGNHRYIRTLGTARDACPEQGDDGGPVAALAVHQHQRGVRRQAPERCRANEGRRVADRFLADVVGGNQARDQGIHVRIALRRELVAADDVDGNGRVGGGTVAAPRADHHDFFDGPSRGGGGLRSFVRGLGAMRGLPSTAPAGPLRPVPCQSVSTQMLR